MKNKKIILSRWTLLEKASVALEAIGITIVLFGITYLTYDCRFFDGLFDINNLLNAIRLNP